MAGIGAEHMVSLNTLVFGSLEFLFWYLPVFLFIFYLVPVKCRNIVLFLGSCVLYAAGEMRYSFLLVGMTGVNYLFGRAMDCDGRKRELLCFLSISCNVGLLAYFKLCAACDHTFLLPVGISFYIFKAISYLADVYRRKISPETSFWRFGAWMCLFCQVVSGPIMRYDTAVHALTRQHLFVFRLEEGLKMVIFGLCAKVLLADRLGILWNDIQTIGFESISTPLAWMGMLAYSMQLYFDFAGYSLIAIGLGRMFGLPVIKNFDHPYAARSLGEFFRCWHMTLGSWFREYIYIPLGGNRKGMLRQVLNLMIVWTLTGIWHGRSVNFVFWGLTVGCMIVLEKLFFGKLLGRYRILSHIYVLTVIPLTWMIFAISSVGEIHIYFSRLFPFFGQGTAVNPKDFGKEAAIFWPVLLAGIMFCIPAVGKWFEQRKNTVWMNVVLFVLFWICVYQISNAANNPFMYAAF